MRLNIHIFNKCLPLKNIYPGNINYDRFSFYYISKKIYILYGLNINLVLVLDNNLVPKCYAHYLVIMLLHTAYILGIKNSDIGDTTSSNRFY